MKRITPFLKNIPKTLSKEPTILTRTSHLLKQITDETKQHVSYLESIGLSDRAVRFKVDEFTYRDIAPDTIDINRFNSKMAIPSIVKEFNPSEKNTLFTTVDSKSDSEENEIKKLLDIRLYPTIKNLIQQHETTVFLGLVTELQAFTASKKEKILFEIEIPSSVKFYLAKNETENVKVYIAGLVSHENLIQQLMTLKLSGIDLNNISILGDPEHFKQICKNDLLSFKKEGNDYLAKRNVLIVAGCHLEETVCTSLNNIFANNSVNKKFTGDIVSLTYVTSKHAPDLGFIVLNLNYGEICEHEVASILEKFNCIGIFTGSAAGFISHDESKPKPPIGDRVAIQSARHHLGETISLDSKGSELHLHVPSIFVETFDWLEKAKKMGATTVDVETFYIVKALTKYLKDHPDAKIHSDIGVFISDYVGQKPLRNYQGVFDKYPILLNDFVQKVLAESYLSSYNNNKNSIPQFEKGYVGLIPTIVPIDQNIRKEAIIENIGKPWDQKEFSKRVHTPVTIAEVSDKKQFTNTDVPRCIHLPIKLPGSDIRIPNEYKHFSDELQKIFNFEASINPKWRDAYAYLTIDQGFVPKSNSQRVPGPHVDGIPRDKENPGSQITDHAYLVTNAIPTMFYTQKFDMQSYDLNKHHFFAIFRALSDESRTITLKPFEIVLMDAYSVHTPTQTEEDVNRTFVRLEFSTLEFDRSGNSINPHFENDKNYPHYPFKYRPRPIPAHLFVPPSVYETKPITNKEFVNESIDKFGRARLRAVFMRDDRYQYKISDYKDLEKIASDIMDEETLGMVVTKNGIIHSFFLYNIENKKVCIHTLFTLSIGIGQESMIYGMNCLKKISNRLALQTGRKPEDNFLQITLNENNKGMLKYFLRAARLAKVDVEIEERMVRCQLRPL